jgi:mandelate racemase
MIVVTQLREPMAAWDACARAREIPLVQLLGGEPRAIAAYASLRTMDPSAAAAEAESAIARGFGGVKLKVGSRDPARDITAIRAVRSAVGDEPEVMVDYNQSLSVDDALKRIRVLDAQGIAWIEEPTRADDYAGHARIAAAASTPIQLGENWWGPHDMEKSVEAGSSDHVTLDVMKLGGVTGWLRASSIASEAGLPASSHTFPELSAHLLAVTDTCHRLEYLDHAGPILTDPVEVRAGTVTAPDRPGSGLEWNESVLGRL